MEERERLIEVACARPWTSAPSTAPTLQPILRREHLRVAETHCPSSPSSPTTALRCEAVYAPNNIAHVPTLQPRPRRDRLRDRLASRGLDVDPAIPSLSTPPPSHVRRDQLVPPSTVLRPLYHRSTPTPHSALRATASQLHIHARPGPLSAPDEFVGRAARTRICGTR